jgi:MoxR-like ATPase
MTRKKRNVFELLSLKEKIKYVKKTRQVGVLREELNRARILVDQLDEAIAATEDEQGEQMAGTLRANGWYRDQMMVQKETVSNRKEFLSTEVANEEKELIQIRLKQDRSRDRAREVERQEAIERESRQDRILNDRGRRRD